MEESRRAVAITLSPRCNAASVQIFPNPRELPVINQILLCVFCIIFLSICNTNFQKARLIKIAKLREYVAEWSFDKFI
jgi:hypothetical protein